MDIEMFGKLSDAFGPSGFEEDVVRAIKAHSGALCLKHDAMHNV